MENNFLGIFIGAASGAIVAIITAIGAFIVNNRNQKDATDKTSNEQAFLLYKQLVETLKKNFDDMQDDYKEIEKSYVECRERCASFRTELEFYKKVEKTDKHD